MTFSLLRRLAGTRGLDAVMQRCQRVFLLGAMGARIESRARRYSASEPFRDQAVQARHLRGAYHVVPPRLADPYHSAILAPVAATGWDVRVLVRAAAVAALVLGLAWLATAATDEGGVSWGERAGRTLPLTPACAAIGAWVALAPVRTRGEALALAALGRSPAQLAVAAVVGAALVALLAAMMIGAADVVDMTAFFPRAARGGVWIWQDSAFVDRAHGVRVGADGVPTSVARGLAVAMTPAPRHGRAAAAMATAIAGLAFPLLTAHALLGRSASASQGGTHVRKARERATSILASGATVAASVFLFQAAGVRHVPALLAAVPPIGLLAYALRRYHVPP